MEEKVQNTQRGFNRKRLVGFVLLLVGATLLLRQSGYPLPHWLFGWETILIIVGLCIGIKNGFRDASWFFMVIVGCIFLVDDIWPTVNIKQFLVPIVVSAVGLIFLFSPKMSHRNRFSRRCASRRHRWQMTRPPLGSPSSLENPTATEEMTDDEFLDITAVFSSVKKKVLSKSFGGADITCVFGGCEIDLMNADFKSPLVIDCTQVFGGTKLLIPPDWEVRTEATTLFGSVEDKRPPGSGVAPTKSIFIDGTMFFGGIEIKSF